VLLFPTTPKSEISNRISCLKEKMEKKNLHAVFLTHKPDIYYFSGTAQDCYLYISLDNDPLLFVKRYFPRAEKESCLKNIIQISSIKQIPEKIENFHMKMPLNCGFAFDVIPVRDFHFYKKLFADVHLTDCTDVVTGCREIKSGYEIEQIKKSAALSAKTFTHIQHNLRPGISEMEFAGEVETFARKFGHSGILLNRNYRSTLYPFHILSGASGGLAGAVDTPCCGTGTSISHPSGAGAKIIESNEPVLIDFGTVLNGYHMDETRMFAINGMEQKAMDAAKASLEILHTVLSGMMPGRVMGDVFNQAVQSAKCLGYEEQFLGLPDLKSKFIGHGTGIELVESPIISKGNKKKLKPGMVFAVEPKLIFKNRFAAGVESVIQITKKGARFLSITPNEIFICK